MTREIFWIFFGVFIVSMIVVVNFARKRERRWRSELLRERPELTDDEIVQLYRMDNATDAAILRIVKCVGRLLHVPSGLLRPDDTIVSLKAPYFTISDDMWALDNELFEAQLADRELAKQTRTIGDVVKLVVNAETKKGREVVV